MVGDVHHVGSDRQVADDEVGATRDEIVDVAGCWVFLACTTTWCPSSTSAAAVAFPSPVVEPVTNTRDMQLLLPARGDAASSGVHARRGIIGCPRGQQTRRHLGDRRPTTRPQRIVGARRSEPTGEVPSVEQRDKALVAGTHDCTMPRVARHSDQQRATRVRRRPPTSTTASRQCPALWTGDVTLGSAATADGGCARELARVGSRGPALRSSWRGGRARRVMRCRVRRCRRSSSGLGRRGVEVPRR